MKTNLHLVTRARNQGSAAIIVVVTMFVLAALAISNSRSIAQLKRELRLIEARQTGKYLESAAKPATSTSNVLPSKEKK